MPEGTYRGGAAMGGAGGYGPEESRTFFHGNETATGYCRCTAERSGTAGPGRTDQRSGSRWDEGGPPTAAAIEPGAGGYDPLVQPPAARDGKTGDPYRYHQQGPSCLPGAFG